MYKDILGPDHNNIGVEYALVSVLPKSGYVAVNNFLRTYDELLNDTDPDVKTFYNFITSTQFKKKQFISAHIECFGFHEHVDRDKLALWSSLQYSDFLPWNLPYDFFPEVREFSPQHRFVFIFRNPLDQLLSYYLFMRGAKEQTFDIQDFVDFIFNRHGLSSYLKLFFTFHVVREKYPEHILFVPYEAIMHDKPGAMKRVLCHLGIHYNAVAFNRAMDLTSLETAKVIQHELLNSGRYVHKHVRDGGIGLWQSKMTPAIVQRIEERFKELGLSLTMFYLADELEPQYKFLQAKSPTLMIA